ncbi:unnamed protein product [Rhodiola kirilowii]
MGSSSANSDEKNNGSSSNNRKERLRWTDELHDRFEEAINNLGGADRATPKGILKTMDIPGLTIYHVKSHLQKYRIAKFVPESSSRVKYEKRSILEMLPNFSTTSALQLNEALRLHMEAEKQLSHQIEASQRLKIEAQGRYMDTITNDLQTGKTIIIKPTEHFNPKISLPSLRDDSESNSPNNNIFEPELQSRALKRFRVEEEFDYSIPRMFKYTPQYLKYAYDGQSVMFNDQGMVTLPWNRTVPGPSPVMPS